MPSRRGTARRGNSTPANRRGGRGVIRKNTRSRQAPSRYGHTTASEPRQPDIDDRNTPSSESDNIEASDPEYSQSSSTHTLPHHRVSEGPSSTPAPQMTPTAPSHPDSPATSTQSPTGSINLNSMRELLRSHEQDIVDRVVQQLSSQHTTQYQPQPLPMTQHYPAVRLPSPPHNTRLTRIAELESQLAELRREQEGQQRILPARPSEPGMYIPIPHQIDIGGESASGVAESVEMLFPAVERSTLIQIIENRFKPTNIYRLLATEKDRAESQRTINIGGVEFEQAERDGKEGEYRMTSFFKAWAAYSGILIKLAPHLLQGELATALAIYTMNLYDLLEKYSWEGVRAYHFQFHRKRVASGKNLYQPLEWRLLDSELVASKCFSHSASRSWHPSYKSPGVVARGTYEIPSHETAGRPTFTYSGAQSATTFGLAEQRTNQSQRVLGLSGRSVAVTGVPPLSGQACRNCNYRECRSSHCRYLHLCISCGSSHQVSHCPVANNGQLQLSRTRPSRR